MQIRAFLVAALVTSTILMPLAEGSTSIALTAAFPVRSVSLGSSLSGTLTVKNGGSTAITLPVVALAARPPGGTHAGGPYLDFGSVANVVLSAGQSRSFTFTRNFTASDPTGTWDAYPTMKLPSGVWSDGASTFLNVTAPAYSRTHVTTSANGIQINGTPFLVKGVAYNPIPVGQTPSSFDWMGTPSIYKADLPKIKAMGANTVRIYSVSSNVSRTRAFLDAAQASGIHVIVGDKGIGSGDAADPATRSATKARVLAMVNALRDHPAVLTWMIGNEIDANYKGARISDWYSLLDEIAVASHAADPDHPVSSAFTTKEQFLTFPSACPHVDLYGLNFYNLDPGALSSFFSLAHARMPTRPVLVSEFGVDAWNTNKSVEYGDVQARLLVRQWGQAKNESVSGSRQSAGGVAFQWVDGWWKDGSPSTHEGTADWSTPSMVRNLPDGAFSEEYMGIARQVPGSTDRTLRPAYAALQAAWSS